MLGGQDAKTLFEYDDLLDNLKNTLAQLILSAKICLDEKFPVQKLMIAGVVNPRPMPGRI